MEVPATHLQALMQNSVIYQLPKTVPLLLTTVQCKGALAARQRISVCSYQGIPHYFTQPQRALLWTKIFTGRGEQWQLLTHYRNPVRIGVLMNRRFLFGWSHPKTCSQSAWLDAAIRKPRNKVKFFKIFIFSSGSTQAAEHKTVPQIKLPPLLQYDLSWVVPGGEKRKRNVNSLFHW